MPYWELTVASVFFFLLIASPTKLVQDVLFCLGENASCMTFVHSGTFLYESDASA